MTKARRVRTAKHVVHMPRQLRGGRSSAVFGTRLYCVCSGCATKGTPGSRTITALAQRRVGQVRAQGSVTRPRRPCPYVCVHAAILAVESQPEQVH